MSLMFHQPEFSIELGKIICVRGRTAATAHDEAMAPLVGPEPTDAPPLPGIEGGVIEAGSPHAGSLFVQGTIGTPRFDDIHGAGWRLVTIDPAPHELDPATGRWFASIGGHVVSVPADDPVYGRWFSEHDATAAPQRPTSTCTARLPRREAVRAARRPAKPDDSQPTDKESSCEDRQHQRPRRARPRRRDRRRRHRIGRAVRPRPDGPVRRLGRLPGLRRDRHRRHRSPGRGASSATRCRGPARCSPSASTTAATPRSPAWPSGGPGGVHQVPRQPRRTLRRHRGRRRHRRLGGRARRRHRPHRRPRRRARRMDHVAG